jgi:hypothetical protein
VLQQAELVQEADCRGGPRRRQHLDEFVALAFHG